MEMQPQQALPVLGAEVFEMLTWMRYAATLMLTRCGVGADPAIAWGDGRTGSKSGSKGGSCSRLDRRAAGQVVGRGGLEPPTDGL
jgi:hypothetical protein